MRGGLKMPLQVLKGLQNNGISKANSPRSIVKFQSLTLQLVSKLNACCSQDSEKSAAILAPMSGRLGMTDDAGQVLLG